MDLCMPNLTGIETLFRADMVMNNHSEPTPVIFYTDFQVEDKVKSTLKHLDVIDCWSKSMNLLKLYSRINRFMIFNAS
jgi:response regulator RpfG family c-di-GMP phosphodiesterase